MSKGITSRSEDYSRWYTDIVIKAELADYSPVKGCMVIRPHGFGIWERMRDALDRMIKQGQFDEIKVSEPGTRAARSAWIES